MSSNSLRTIAAICAIALTLLIGFYVIKSTPLCEVFSTERTETYEQPRWPGADETLIRTDTYIERWSEPRGQCVEAREVTWGSDE